MILIIDNNTKLMKYLHAQLKRYKQEYKTKNIRSVRWSDIEKADAIILTGGPSIPDIDKRVVSKAKQLIRRINKPTLGICLGFQMICHAHGSALIRLPERRKAIMDIKIVRQNELFKGYKKLRVYEYHRHTINKVSTALETLAVSEDGIEAVKHKKKPIYGVEFHPEIRRKNQGYKSLENFLKLIK